MDATLEVDLLTSKGKKSGTAIARNVDLVNDTLAWFSDWLPQLYDLSGKRLYPDSHWDVLRLWDRYIVDPDCEIIVLDYEKKIQGYIIMQARNYKGGDERKCGHVKFLTVAPWNKTQNSARVCRGTGKLLLGIAIIISFWNNDTTAIELESLKESESFYRNLGMIPTGLQKDGMLQFKFEPSAANVFFDSVKDRIRRGRKT